MLFVIVRRVFGYFIVDTGGEGEVEGKINYV